MLKNRDLEIYVTLPSAEKRLFVDVQEEVSVPLSSPSSSSSSHRAKRPKLNTQKGDSEKSKSSLSIASSAAASSSKLTSASSHSSKVAQTSSKIGPSPLGPKDPNAVTPAASSTAATVPAKDKDAANSRTIPSQKMKNTDSSAPRIPYATFEHVKLNVRVRPPVAKKEKENGKASSGITVEALSKTSSM